NRQKTIPKTQSRDEKACLIVQEFDLFQVALFRHRGGRSHPAVSLNLRGQDTVISMLQQRIDQAAADSPTMPVLIERLQQQCVGVWVHFVEDRKARKAGRVDARKVQGISYSWNGVSVPGSRVGARYSFNGLQKEKYAGVSYDPERDDEAIRDLLNRQTEGMGTVPPTTETLQDDQDSNGDQGNGTDDTGPEWKLLPSFANIRHAQEAITPRDEPVDTESTDGDDEDSGMGGRTRQSDDEDGSRDLLDAIEGERLLEPFYAAPTEPIGQEVVQFTGTPDSDRAETGAEFDDRTEPIEETQEPPAIDLDEDETSTDTYIYDTSPEASQPPEVSDPLEAARQKLRGTPAQELSDDERQLLRRHYRTIYEKLEAQINIPFTEDIPPRTIILDRSRAVVELAASSGLYTDSELRSIAVMGDYAKLIKQESGNKEKVDRFAWSLVKEVKTPNSQKSNKITKKRQTDQER
ncbi:MAG: hypothetical protein SFW36_04050, partial [Leptolyngbyaceae cyanobacterium bins.59]|nr:hypothetical protein [Leptolyngbyaceae cyanobacterium bins.59]